MPSTIVQKLKIREGFTLLTFHAPAAFKKDLGSLPPGVTLSENSANYNQVHWCVENKAHREMEVKKLVGFVKDDVICWIYYPKASSNKQTDLTRDKGWEALLQYEHLQWISLISFNDTWSAFGMRLKTEADKKKESKPKERPIFNYIDAAQKTVRLPDDFIHLLAKHKKEKAFFDSLSFTNKKEYVEWIVNAKREETRTNRLKQSIDRLAKGWKNPANQ